MKESNDLIIFIIIAVLVIFLFSGFGGMMPGYGMMGGFGGMWIFGFLFMTLILVALILFILWLVKQIEK